LNFFGLSPGELILILLVAMIVLGPEKLPETAASIGKWIREFRRATQELTQQFADENPFAELQRALSLDEPISLNPTPAPPPAVEAPAVAPLVVSPATDTVPALAPTAVAPATLPAIAPPKSDYFSRPSPYPAIDDQWVHAGLGDLTDRVAVRLRPYLFKPIDDAWVHGAPVPVPVKDQAPDVILDAIAAARAAVEAPPTNGISFDSPLGEAPTSNAANSVALEVADSPPVNGVHPFSETTPSAPEEEREPVGVGSIGEPSPAGASESP
jgi:sec-independent protein translocase protein TatB